MRQALICATVVLTVALLSGCSNMSQKKDNLTDLDTTVRPGDDFYRYAVGHWQKNNPIPAEYSSWGSFVILGEENLKVLREIMERAAKRPRDSREKMVGDFYAGGMDEQKIEAAGLQPLQPELARIEAIRDLTGLALELAHMQQTTSDPLFSFGVAPDLARSDRQIVHLDQGGLNLPDRDYYLKNDLYSREIRTKYQLFVARIFKLMGEDERTSAASARTVLKIETALAKISRTKVALRDPRQNYHPQSLAALAKLAPNFAWPLYFRAIGLTKPGKINVGQPEFLAGLNKLLVKIPLAEWKVYLAFTLVNDNAEYLSSAFVNEEFAFYAKTMNGNQVLRPRWKRVVGTVNAYLDHPVGRLFVQKRFSPHSKKRASQMIESIRRTFARRIKGLDWMSPRTKQAAQQKLAAMTFKIGYPDKWRDYSKLKIERNSYLANIFRGNYFDFHYELNKVGKPVDRQEWQMPAQIVNAGYMPQRNEMIFPAGILQPPFFDAAADDAINYGSIGTIMAHEMTHGFDDQGRKFDAKGNLKDWWSKKDEANFKAKTKGVVAQFGAYTPFPGLPLNGKLTLGENLADLGGLSLAYEALGSLPAGKKPQPRFFLSYARVWRNNTRPERAKLLIKVDPHSPAQYRVNGPLSNLPEFYQAFNLISGEAMYKPAAQRVKVW
ncbi:MAG: M13 family metallopeptidase [Candidatus Margulisiibacteriota bacterium]